MKNALSLQNVTKMYGRSRGVESVSIEVPTGSIYGFLGPNGAGKTTTISMVMDIIAPTSGAIEILGKPVGRSSHLYRQDIGFLTSDMALDPTLTGQQQLEYFGYIRGVYHKKYVQELATALSADLTRKIKTLSRGNRQKIGLLSALMHKPKLLVLDEPTSGLDPLVQESFADIIHRHQATGGTTFMSSHVLSEVQALCDRVAFIKEGKVIAQDTVARLLSAAPYVVTITSDSAVAAIITLLPSVVVTEKTKHSATLTYKGDINKLLHVLSKHKLQSVEIAKADLDQIFVHQYQGDSL